MPEICSKKKKITYKSRGLGQAKPGPSRGWRLWPGLGFEQAKAASGQAKAGAFRPSRAGTALITYNLNRDITLLTGNLLGKN